MPLGQPIPQIRRQQQNPDPGGTGEISSASRRPQQPNACIIPCGFLRRRLLADLIPRLPAPKIESTLLICDEVHGFGEPSLVQRLSGLLRPFPYRLGLSATPTREYDQDGNKFIEEEIGPVIYTV